MFWNTVLANIVAIFISGSIAGMLVWVNNRPTKEQLDWEKTDIEDRKIEKELWPNEERMFNEQEWKKPLWGKRTRFFDELTGKYQTKK